MNPSAIYSKSGKGVQEASGKTSLLKRGDRAVLSAIDGRATVSEVAQKVGKPFDGAFQALIAQLEREGFVREVTSGAGAPAAKAPAAKPQAAAGEDLDFTGILTTSALKSAAAPKPADDAARRAKEQEQALYRARQEAEARAQQERERARAEGEAKARAEAEAKFRAEAEKKLRDETAAKLKAEAEAKAKAAREAAVRLAAEAKAKAEAEARAKIEAERKAREEAERRAKEEAERIRREAEAAAQAKIEAERKAREEAERKAREEAERAKREAEELRQRLEEERRAREEEERRRKEEEERRRKEEEERRAREEAERKAREEAERKAREEAERKAREEAERKAREAEEQRRREEEAERRRKEEEERRRQEVEAQRQEAEAQRQREEQEAKARQAREEAERRAEEERKARQEQERKRQEQERERQERERREQETKRREAEAEAAAAAAAAAAEVPAEAPAAPAAPPKPVSTDAGLDALLDDIESFSQRQQEEEKRRQAEAAERRAREEAERKAQAERHAREEAERERREAEERRRKEEQEARAREEAERRSREEEERIQEAARRRKAEAAAAAAAAAAAPAADDDIGVTDADLDMDDVRQDEAAVSKEARKAQREREREARKREKEARSRERLAARTRDKAAVQKPVAVRRPRRWGRSVALTLFVLLVAGIAALHFMPVPVQDYEQAASEALGRPVRIGSARLSLVTGVALKLRNVTIGSHVKIAAASAHPRIGSLFGEEKSFDRIDLEGVTLGEPALGEALFGARARGPHFAIERVTASDVRVVGPLALPPLSADLRFADDGALRIVRLDGPEGLIANLTPGPHELQIDVTAARLALPIAPELALGSFAMKGTATRQGMRIESWGGTLLDGALSGTANVRWDNSWQVEGVLTARGVNAAVFAPALLSRGKADGTGKFFMSAANPARLAASSRIEGRFTVEKGVLGSFDLSRALQTEGRQAGGRTEFAEMSGQGTYERGAVSLRNVSIGAGALQAGASADIAPNGALSGRIVADIRTASQALRTSLVLGGTVKDPQVRN